MSWHAEPQLLEAYARGKIDPARAFSIEAHVLECGECRMRAAALVDDARLARVWAAVEARVDRPRRTPVESLLVRAGVRGHVARLLAATPSLTLSWLTAVSLCLLFAVAAAHVGPRGLVVFLALAPLLPLAGVAVAYGPGVDPTYELSVASPMRGFRLLLLRAGAVLTTTIVLVGVAALALPQVGSQATCRRGPPSARSRSSGSSWRASARPRRTTGSPSLAGRARSSSSRSSLSPRSWSSGGARRST